MTCCIYVVYYMYTTGKLISQSILKFKYAIYMIEYSKLKKFLVVYFYIPLCSINTF